MITRSDLKQTKTHPHSSKDANEQLLVAAAIGVDDVDRAKRLVESGVDAIVVESLQGDTKVTPPKLEKNLKLRNNDENGRKKNENHEKIIRLIEKMFFKLFFILVFLRHEGDDQLYIN